MERKGYSATKRKAEKQGYQADFPSAMENRGTRGDEIKKPLVMSANYNKAEKAGMTQWCNDIRKSCTFGFVVFIVLIVVTVLSILYTIFF